MNNQGAGGNYTSGGTWYEAFNYCPYCGHSLSGPHAPGYYGNYQNLGAKGQGGPAPYDTDIEKK